MSQPAQKWDTGLKPPEPQGFRLGPTQPCETPDGAGLCAGPCPGPGGTCLAVSPTSCACRAGVVACGGRLVGGQCAGLCENIHDECRVVAPNNCDCAPRP